MNVLNDIDSYREWLLDTLLTYGDGRIPRWIGPTNQQRDKWMNLALFYNHLYVTQASSVVRFSDTGRRYLMKIGEKNGNASNPATVP